MRNREVKETLADAIMSLMTVCVFLPLLEILDRLDFQERWVVELSAACFSFRDKCMSYSGTQILKGGTKWTA